MLPKKSCHPNKRGSKKRLSFVFLACLSAFATLFDGCVSKVAVENPEITFTIIQTNGQKEPASMASFIKDERSRSENLVLADNAGFFEQAGFSSFYNGGSLAPLKNAYKIMGYDAVYAGKAYIVKNFGEKKSALKIGIISGEQTASTLNSSSAQKVAAGSFAKIEKTVRKLRIKEKCGIILLLLNAGENRAELIAENVPGIDMILCGGTNPNYFEPWKVRQTMIVSVKDSGRFAGKAEVTYTGSQIAELKWENIEINSKNFPPDEEIAAIIAPYKKEYAENLKKPLFELTENLEFGKRLCRKYDTRLGGFIADMQEQFVENLVKPVDRLGIFSGGIDFSIINGGRIRCGLNKGNITAEDIKRVLPFENFLYVVQMKGSSVQNLFEEAASRNQGADGFLQVSSGISLSLEYDETGRNGKLLQVLIDGAPVDPERTYTVAVNDFLLNGGDGYTAFQDRLSEYNTRVLVSEAVAAAASNLAATSSVGARQTEAAPQNGIRIHISGGISE